MIQISRESLDSNQVTKKLYLGAIEQEWASANADPDVELNWRAWSYSLTHTRVYISTPSGVVGSLTHHPDGLDAFAALERNYFHYDHLGSVVEVTGSFGAIVESLGYDVWGQRRDADSWLRLADPREHPELGTDRGFTGHEMLDHLGLVHMNARIYDPVIGRFISADSVLQFPDNIQSYDRYQYVLNNPCTFTDPSGHFIPLIAGAILVATKAGIYTTIITMAITSAAWAAINGASLKDSFKAGLMAAGMAAVSFGIGGLFGHAPGDAGLVNFDGNVLAQETCRAAAHGVTGGISEELNGGSFGTGFASSFMASAASSAISVHYGKGTILGTPGDGNVQKTFARTAIAATIGGTVAEIGGDKFANGCQVRYSSARTLAQTCW